MGFHLAALENRHGLFSIAAGRGYHHIVALLYTFMGSNILIPRLFNAFLGALLPFFIFDLTLNIFGDKKVARLAFQFSAFLPPLLLYSAVALKGNSGSLDADADTLGVSCTEDAHQGKGVDSVSAISSALLAAGFFLDLNDADGGNHLCDFDGNKMAR